MSEQLVPRVAAQFLRFAVVGVFGTAAHYAVLGAFVEWAGVSVLLGTTAGFTVGALVSYVLNRRFTFASHVPHALALPKFLAVAVAGAVINWVVVAWLLAHLDVHYLLIQLFATGAVLVWNFVANSIWTFRA